MKLIKIFILRQILEHQLLKLRFCFVLLLGTSVWFYNYLFIPIKQNDNYVWSSTINLVKYSELRNIISG